MKRNEFIKKSFLGITALVTTGSAQESLSFSIQNLNIFGNHGLIFYSEDSKTANKLFSCLRGFQVREDAKGSMYTSYISNDPFYIYDINSYLNEGYRNVQAEIALVRMLEPIKYDNLDKFSKLKQGIEKTVSVLGDVKKKGILIHLISEADQIWEVKEINGWFKFTNGTFCNKDVKEKIIYCKIPDFKVFI